MPATPPINIPITAQDKTRAAFRSVDDRMNRLSRSVGGLYTQLAAVAGVGGMGAVISKSADLADQMAKMSAKTGVAVEELSTLKRAAELSGTNIDTLAKGIKSLNTAQLDAARGSKEQREAFRLLNVEFMNADGTLRDTREVFDDVATAFSNMEDGATKVALANKLMGRSGFEMIPLLNSGADGIRRMQGEARQFGEEISTNAAKQAEKFNDNLRDIKAAATGLGLAFTTNLLPALNEITSAMAEAAKDGGPLKAMWVGLGGAASQLLYGNELKQAKTDVENLTNEYERLAQNLKTANQRGAITQFIFGGKDEIQGELNRVAGELVQAKLRLQALMNPVQPAPGGGTPKPGGLLPAPGAGSEDDKEKEKAAAERDRTKERLELLHALEYEMKQTHYGNLRNLEDEYLESSKVALSGYSQFQSMTWQQQASTVFGEMANITAGVAQHNKTLFKINKVAGIANAIMSAHEGASRTLAKYPWPLGPALAALHYAAGIARVQAIRSTSFSGGGGGSTPSSVGGTPTINDTPVAAPQQQAPRQTATINLYGSSFDGNQVRDLIDKINEQLGDGAVLNVNLATT